VLVLRAAPEERQQKEASLLPYLPLSFFSFSLLPDLYSLLPSPLLGENCAGVRVGACASSYCACARVEYYSARIRVRDSRL
jgi:hypothetical protein